MSSVAPASQEVVRFGALPLATRYLLSPLAGYTNLAFRLAVRELGPIGLATTDLISARGLLMQSKKTFELLQLTPEDHPVAIQLYGADTSDMRGAAQWLEDYGADVIDINMGCPVNKVTRGGGGSAMMCDSCSATEVVRAVVEAVRIPVTVKMRLGWDDDHITAPEFAREFEKVGVAAVIIHGRTREQGFRGSVNLDGIRKVVDAVDRIPVIGNGDAKTIADVDHMRKVTGCAGVSIGRGALLNPWIFRQLDVWEKTSEVEPLPSFEQRVDFMQKHFHLLVKYRGERMACLTFRKMSGWYCKVLKPGREIQQQLVMINSATHFNSIVDRIRGQGPPRGWDHRHQPTIAVPKGPISHW